MGCEAEDGGVANVTPATLLEVLSSDLTSSVIRPTSRGSTKIVIDRPFVWEQLRRMSAAHPGFKNVQAKIARRQGVSLKRAGAILAAGTRRAGAAARRKNPRLNRVKRGRSLRY